MTEVPLYTFSVDGEQHLLHATWPAIMTLLETWGPMDHVEITRYVENN